MSLGILNNIAAIYAQNNLNQTQASLQTTLNQLSSGSRINSGADDAAGLAVVDGLGANIAALTQSSQNATDGIGLLQTADGALSQVTNLLDRAVTLSTEAANGTLNSNQVSSANQEYQNILNEIGDIGTTTNFNSNSVFSNIANTVFVSDGTGSGANVYSDIVGVLSKSNVGQSAPVGAGVALTSGTATTSSLTTGSSVTFSALTNYNDTIAGTLSVSVAGGTAINSTIATGTSLTDAVNQLNDQYNADGSGIVASIGSGNKLVLTGPEDAENTTAGTNVLAVSTNTLEDYAPAAAGATAGAGINFTNSDVSTLTQSSAQTVLTTVTSAIAGVAYQRGIIGADINQLTAASNVASAESENLTSAQSSIQSTNYGQATSDLAKYQVLSQTGISALAQANSVQQEVLKLLQ